MDITLTLSTLLASKPGATMSHLARHCGVTPQAVQQWLTGITTPKGARLKKIAEYFGVTELELLTGTVAEDLILEDLRKTLHEEQEFPPQQSGPATAHSPSQSASMSLHNDEIPDYIRFKVWPKGEIGGAGPIRSMEISKIWAYSALGHRDLTKVQLTIMVDDTMEPTISSGALLFIENKAISDRELIEGGIYVFRYDGRIHVKRMQKTGERVVVKSDNPLYDTWHIDSADMKSLSVHARVVGSLPMNIRKHG